MNRYELLDHQGELVGTRADLLVALQDCPEDGCVYDSLMGRDLTIEDLAQPLVLAVA